MNTNPPKHEACQLHHEGCGDSYPACSQIFKLRGAYSRITEGHATVVVGIVVCFHCYWWSQSKAKIQALLPHVSELQKRSSKEPVLSLQQTLSAKSALCSAVPYFQESGSLHTRV